jgi:hypothetical protein
MMRTPRPTIRVTGRQDSRGQEGPRQYLTSAWLRHGNRSHRRLARPRQNRRCVNLVVPDCGIVRLETWRRVGGLRPRAARVALPLAGFANRGE